jgi:transcriptional regulator with XRE-family HTH domain
MTQKFDRLGLNSRLREIIKKFSLSQAQLAKHGNISTGTVRNILFGNSSPTVTALIYWSKNLNLT